MMISMMMAKKKYSDGYLIVISLFVSSKKTIVRHTKIPAIKATLYNTIPSKAIGFNSIKTILLISFYRYWFKGLSLRYESPPRKPLRSHP